MIGTNNLVLFAIKYVSDSDRNRLQQLYKKQLESSISVAKMVDASGCDETVVASAILQAYYLDHWNMDYHRENFGNDIYCLVCSLKNENLENFEKSIIKWEGRCSDSLDYIIIQYFNMIESLKLLELDSSSPKQAWKRKKLCAEHILNNLPKHCPKNTKSYMTLQFPWFTYTDEEVEEEIKNEEQRV